MLGTLNASRWNQHFGEAFAAPDAAALVVRLRSRAA